MTAVLEGSSIQDYRISIGEGSDSVLSISSTPDIWEMPVRINEAALRDADKIRDEAVECLAHESDEEESDID